MIAASLEFTIANEALARSYVRLPVGMTELETPPVELVPTKRLIARRYYHLSFNVPCETRQCVPNDQPSEILTPRLVS